MVAYKTLTAVNIALMCLLVYRAPQPFQRVYLIAMAIAAAFQNSAYWHVGRSTLSVIQCPVARF